MSLQYEILSGVTVPSTYSWDFGMPLIEGNSQLTQNAYSTKTYISGFAPGLRVYFKNTTNYPVDIFQNFLWEFNDAYNDVNSTVIVSGLSTIFHDYLIPGVYYTTLSSSETTLTLQNVIVQVYELPPVANLQSLFLPITGYDSKVIYLSPHKTKPGSYPIDQIDWDFGDGSPIITVSRYTPPKPEEFIFTNKFSNDYKDPRNYAAKHTYIRNPKEYGMFYPSITAYAANTGTSSSCSTPIGPILVSPQDNSKTHLLQVHASYTGNLYAVQNNNNIGFITSSIKNNVVTPAITKPNSVLKDSFGLPEPLYQGNPGVRSYPPLIQTADSLFSNTVFLLDFFGLNNSTEIIDRSSFKNIIVNPLDNVAINTNNSPFEGVNNGNFPGGRLKQLSVENTSNFNIEANVDFSFEMYFLHSAPVRNFLGLASFLSPSGKGFTLYYFENLLLWGVPEISNDIGGTFIPQINRWYHVLIQRKNNSLSMVIDGTIIDTQTVSKAFSVDDLGSFNLGDSHRGDTLNAFSGRLAQIRLTVGTTRYDLAPITGLPPTQPFPIGEKQFF